MRFSIGNDYLFEGETIGSGVIRIVGYETNRDDDDIIYAYQVLSGLENDRGPKKFSENSAFADYLTPICDEVPEITLSFNDFFDGLGE